MSEANLDFWKEESKTVVILSICWPCLVSGFSSEAAGLERDGSTAAESSP
jgi:hypothetical protein